MAVKKGKRSGFMYFEIAAVALCALIAVVVFLMLLFTDVFSRYEDDSSTELAPNALATSGTTESGKASVAQTTAPTESHTISDFEVKSVDNAEMKKGSLILVNNDNLCELPKETDLIKLYDEIHSADRTVSYKLGSGSERLKAETYKKLDEFCTAFYDSTNLKNLTVRYAFFDMETQASEYAKAVTEMGEKDASVWAQKPGGSDHGTGYSFDLMLYPANGGKIGEGEYKWITDHAWEYGFIRRYPADKTSITFVRNEETHFRYVGVPHAYYMFTNNLCLEEYIIELKKYSAVSPLKIKAGNKTYYTHYQLVADTSMTDIYVPKNTEYEISGNNVDGFIVTYSK